MKIDSLIYENTVLALKTLYNFVPEKSLIQIQNTRKDLIGDITLVVFPLIRFSKKSAEETGREIGEFVTQRVQKIRTFNVIKGFLNFEISDDYWLDILLTAFEY